MNLAQLWAALNQHGVSLTLTAEGKLRPRAAQPPPPELVDAMREHKAALLEELQAPRSKSPESELLTLAQQPGHCGCCARWEAIPERAHLGMCSAGRAAHGWLDGAALAPVETQMGLSCQVYGGKGWRAMQKNATGARHNVAGLPAPREAMPAGLERPA